MSWEKGEYHPKQQRSEEKKRRILHAALELFGSEGFHDTTAKAIAARADVATGSFYRYFRDKKAAFIAVCARLEQELGGGIFRYGNELRREGRPERAVLASMVQFAVAGHRRHKAFHREVLAMRIQDPDLAAWAGEREQRILATLADFLRAKRSEYRVRDLDAAAELILCTIEEISHRAILFDSPAGEQRLVRELQEMLTRYLFE
jgi:AcrR family transcriptional regulator